MVFGFLQGISIGILLLSLFPKKKKKKNLEIK
jgi:hypothetical protein